MSGKEGPFSSLHFRKRGGYYPPIILLLLLIHSTPHPSLFKPFHSGKGIAYISLKSSHMQTIPIKGTPRQAFQDANHRTGQNVCVCALKFNPTNQPTNPSPNTPCSITLTQTISHSNSTYTYLYLSTHARMRTQKTIEWLKIILSFPKRDVGFTSQRSPVQLRLGPLSTNSVFQIEVIF